VALREQQTNTRDTTGRDSSLDSIAADSAR
jgi:hypothetical protein